MEDQSLVVPPEMAAEAEAVVKLLNDAAQAQGLTGDVYLLRPKSKDFGPEELQTLKTLVIAYSGATAGWLTKKWIDEYLWPVIKDKIDRPSMRFVNWLKESLP